MLGGAGRVSAQRIHSVDDCCRARRCVAAVRSRLVETQETLRCVSRAPSGCARSDEPGAVSAGHAFSEALHMVSTEMPEPIATEFRKTYEEQNLGLSLKLALENLTQRIPLLDLRMCVTAVLIQRETGGNLAEILEKVAYTIRERFRIMGDLKTLTTSSRMSAWLLCGLPIFVAFAITVMNPEYMSVLWKDPRGHYLIATAMFMQVTGMLIVRKILNIKI